MSSALKSWVRKMTIENCVLERKTFLIPGGVAPVQPGPAIMKSPASLPVARLPM